MHHERTTADELPLPDAGCAVVPSPVGPLAIGWVPEGIVLLHFADTIPKDALARVAPELASVAPGPLSPPLEEALSGYFAGSGVDPARLPVRLAGTEFQRRVWTALRSVARGQVRTYAGLAADARSPRAMRAVGTAMATNPIAIVVPCHRVIGAGHALGGYSGGLERKRTLLELEGVRVEGDVVRPGQLMLGD